MSEPDEHEPDMDPDADARAILESMSGPEEQEPRVDPDADARSEALRFMARRTLTWAVPLSLVGLLLIGLGIPWWISVPAMLAVLAVLVFELEI